VYKGEFFPIRDFRGGYSGNLPATALNPSQALDVDNMVVLPGGMGIRSRYGNDKQHLAEAVIQDITYSASSIGVSTVTVAYTDGATAGSEVVTVVGNAISIQIESGVSTATQVKAKFDAKAEALALAAATITGTGSTAQTAPVSATALTSAALNSGAAIQGIGHLLTADQDRWLATIAGDKFYVSEESNGEWEDETGTIDITPGAHNRWDMFTFKDNLICFGGDSIDPDAPFKWNATDGTTALSGSAPEAYGGFSANNRVFAFRTETDPSSIFWSIIGSEDDWTGAGSGSAVAGSLSDGQRLTGAIVISTNYVLLFKENSTYQMVISSAPFPIYSLFDNVGAAGKNAMVNVDGTVFFIDSRGVMHSTDGENLTNYPVAADDLWGDVHEDMYENITGFREQGIDHDWLVWCVSTNGTTNNLAIVWDIENKCWLKCSTGYKMNVIGRDDKSQVYLGGYDGFIYRPSVSTRRADASETAPGTITSYWRSGWINPSAASQIVQVRKIVAQYKTQASGNIGFTYGFDFTPDSASFNLSLAPTTTESYTSRGTMLTGRGNFFQFKLGQSSSTVGMELHSLLLHGKTYGQKVISNP